VLATAKTAREGVMAGLAAYLMWGLLPVYFKIVGNVDPTEVLAHRVIWALPFGAVIIMLRRQWPEVGHALTNRSMLRWLGVSALFVGMQFLAPTMQFLIGIYYGEVLTTAHLICFGLIWTAVAFFIFDAVKKPPPERALTCKSRSGPFCRVYLFALRSAASLMTASATFCGQGA